MRSIKEIYPQGTLVSVTEQGLFEDFVLKSKERMCGRAQLEIMRITEQLTQKFVENADKDDAKIVDVRGKVAWGMGHIPKAIPIWYEDFDKGEVKELPDKNQKILLTAITAV
mgnify:CR=1 FL=1